MAKKQFKTESKKILDLMINSIYTHKEIFLRELISNASDAIDKLCYMSLTDANVGLNRDDFKITVKIDRDARRITVSDNGVGMSEDELENNLGIIARSGSQKFKAEMEKTEDIDIIGQFGVGFYSSFMVANKVAVITKKYGEDAAHSWVSTGADGYTISECEKEAVGTDVVIELKEDDDNEKYSEFLDESLIKDIIKKYSDYVRWPIILGEETVNSRIPIWQKSKTEVTDEDCAKFYKEKFHDFNDPARVIRVNAEGTVSYKAMLFVPEKAPFDFYSASYESGLQLYTSGVMIMEKCSELLPEHFRFVQGVVDSQDLSLNISREMLQQNRQVKVIATSLEKKIKAELKKMLDTEPDKYAEFFRTFGLQLKYGVVARFGEKKELLSDIIMFYSRNNNKLIPLSRYVSEMKDEQKFIYYACAESVAIAEGLPQTEPIKDKGYDILYLTENVDEFVMQLLGEYEGKQFKSVYDEDLGLGDESEKKEKEEAETENKELLDFVKESLGEQVFSVRISKNLKSHPVCLTTTGEISLEMERYFHSLPADEGANVKAQRVLELNASHPVFEALKKAWAEDKEKAGKYAQLLYDQSLLIAGLEIENPSEYTDLVCSLIV